MITAEYIFCFCNKWFAQASASCCESFSWSGTPGLLCWITALIWHLPWLHFQALHGGKRTPCTASRWLDRIQTGACKLSSWPPGTQHCRKTPRACSTSSWPHCWWTRPLFLVKDHHELVAGNKLKHSLHNSPSFWAPILCFLKVSNEWHRSRGKEAERIPGTKMDSGLVAVPCN